MPFDQHIAAGIDLGSNTFRLLVARCAGNTLTVLEKKLVTVRLGQGVPENRILHEYAMEKGLEVLSVFRQRLDHYQPQSVRAYGTQALRLAKNSHNFVRKAEKALNVKIDIITGKEEALLSLAGTLSGFKGWVPGPFLLADVGGGSTELVFTGSGADGNTVESIPLGAVSLTEKFLSEPQHDIGALDDLLSKTITNALEKLGFPEKYQPVTILGCGGTATSLAALDLNLASYNESLVHGHLLQTETMESLWSRLIQLPPVERNKLPCLGEGRGEILPAGLRIYQMLLKLTQQKVMRASDTGLLEGIVLSSFADIDLQGGSLYNFIPKT